MNHRQPFMPLLAGAACGILLAEAVNPWIWGLVALALALAGFVILRLMASSPEMAVKTERLNLAWIGLLALASGLLAAAYDRPIMPDFENDRLPVRAFGVVEAVETGEYGDRATVTLTSLRNDPGMEPATCRLHNVKVVVSGLTEPLAPGDRISFLHELRSIEARSGQPHIARYQRMQQRRHLLYRQWLTPAHGLCIYPGSPTLKSVSHAMSSQAGIWIEKSGLDRRSQRLLSTCLIGDRGLITRDERLAFSAAGLAHVLALSGLHVGIIVGIVMWLLSPLNLRCRPWVRYAASVVLLWLFVLLTGFGLSVVRAAVMATFVLAAYALQRPANSLNNLWTAAFFILMVTPWALYDAGFQLSVVTVAALLWFAGPLSDRMRTEGRIGTLVGGTLLTTLIATGASWALAAYYFGQVPLLFLPVNLLVLPLVPVYLLGGITLVVSHALGLQLPLLAGFIDLLTDGAFRLAEGMEASGSALAFTPHWLTVALWLLALAVAVLSIAQRPHSGRPRMRRAGIYASAMLAMAALVAIPVLKTAEPDGFSLSYSNGQVWAELQHDGEPRRLLLPQRAMADIRLKGHRLVWADMAQEHWPEMEEGTIVVVGDHFRQKGGSGGLRGCHVVLSPGMHPGKEASLAADFESAGATVHSIRKQGNPYFPGK